jgi:predicted nucleotidyltransferase
MIDLITQQQDKIAEHCRRLNVRRLDVFGSAVNGNFNPDTSDLDFLVEFGDHDKPGIFKRYFALVNSLEAMFNRKVDLVTADAVSKPRFRANLEATKEPVYVL